MGIEVDVFRAVSSAIVAAQHPIVEIDSIVSNLRNKHPQCSEKEIAELIIEAVGMMGGAVAWTGKPNHRDTQVGLPLHS
jgi:hypothetical protein